MLALILLEIWILGGLFCD